MTRPDPNGWWLTHRRDVGEHGGNSWPNRVAATWEPLPDDDAGTVTLGQYRAGDRPKGMRT